MIGEPCFRLSRRRFLEANAALLVWRQAWAKGVVGPLLQWRLDDRSDLVRESVSGLEHRIASRTGHAIWVGESRDRALRFDGYSVWVEDAANFVSNSSGFTLSAWLALEAYPMLHAAVVSLVLPGSTSKGLHLGLNRWGFLEAAPGEGASKTVCTSTNALPRYEWVHVAVAIRRSGEAVLYCNGIECGSAGGFAGSMDADKPFRINLGKGPGEPLVAGVFETGTINGLLRDICLFSGALSQAMIRDVMAQSAPSNKPALQLDREWCADDPQRPRFHAMPPRAWTNEPHGCIFWRGNYHLFYQKNANGPYWGNINWGHMTSPDLYQWTEMPVALSPAPGVDSEGCWSGSVIDHDGKLALIYTGGDGHRASICLALSEDGANFRKYERNPIIAVVPEGHNFPEFRDPFVWREGKTFYMVIGSAIKDVGGTALLYRSANLTDWVFLRTLLTGKKETSGTFWEMPIFVKVGEYHVLIVCEVPGRASYWVGHWINEEFQPLATEPKRLELFNHLLSPTPHVDRSGRVIVMGIIPDERRPSETWKAGWAHLYALPRVLSVNASGELCQTPLETIQSWRTEISNAAKLSLPDGVMKAFTAASGAEIELDLRRGDSHAVSLYLRRSPDGKEQTELRYEWETGLLTFDRRQSSLNTNVRRDLKSVVCKTAEADRMRFRIFLDQSVVEVFIDGTSTFATRIYPTLPDSDGFAVASTGGRASIESIRIGKIIPPELKSTARISKDRFLPAALNSQVQSADIALRSVPGPPSRTAPCPAAILSKG